MHNKNNQKDSFDPNIIPKLDFPADLAEHPATKDRRPYIILSFRGTSNYIDVFKDITFLKRDIDINGKVHGGFLSALNEVWGSYFDYPSNDEFRVDYVGIKGVSEVLNEIKNTKNNCDIYFTGHSLGGAMATLAAYKYEPIFDNVEDDNNKNHIPLTAIYTIGSPKSMTFNLAKKVQNILDSKINFQIYRIVNHSDIIPRLPFSFFGFKHLKKEVLLTKYKEAILNPHIIVSILIAIASPTLGFFAISLLSQQGIEIIKDAFTTEKWIYNIVTGFTIFFIYFHIFTKFTIFLTDHKSENYYQKLLRQLYYPLVIPSFKALWLAYTPHIFFIVLAFTTHYLTEMIEDHYNNILLSNEWSLNFIITTLFVILFFIGLKK